MRTDGKPCWPPVSQDELVPPYTLDDFMKDLDEACKTAWENGRLDLAVIRIPNGMFPNLAEYRNPITRSVIKVEHGDAADIGMCIYAVPPYPKKEEV